MFHRNPQKQRGAPKRPSSVEVLLWLADASLELEAHGQLRLARITHADAEETVEVEESRSAQRVHVVLVVEGVEHFDLRDKLQALAEMERAVDAEVEGNEGVVLAQRVTPLIHTAHKTRLRRDRLSGM